MDMPEGPGMNDELEHGLVALLATDVEGSTALTVRLGDDAASALFAEVPRAGRSAQP
jgi:class 3 adenylate cyclase